MRKVTEAAVNNGSGLYDSEGLIDTLISDCNNAVRACIGGQYIAFCNTMVQMVQKLGKLKSGVQNEMASKEETINRLKRQLRELGAEIEEVPAERLTEIVGRKSNGED